MLRLLNITKEHLDSWTAAARVVKDLAKAIGPAKARDAEIGRRRAALVPEKAAEKPRRPSERRWPC